MNPWSGEWAPGRGNGKKVQDDLDESVRNGNAQSPADASAGGRPGSPGQTGGKHRGADDRIADRRLGVLRSALWRIDQADETKPGMMISVAILNRLWIRSRC